MYSLRPRYRETQESCRRSLCPLLNYLSRTTGDPDIDGTEEKYPRLIYISGTICSSGPEAIYQLHLSYGFEAPEVFERAVRLMAEACAYASV